MLSVVRTDTLSRGCADPVGAATPWARGVWPHRCPHRLHSPHQPLSQVLPPVSRCCAQSWLPQAVTSRRADPACRLAAACSNLVLFSLRETGGRGGGLPHTVVLVPPAVRAVRPCSQTPPARSGLFNDCDVFLQVSDPRSSRSSWTGPGVSTLPRRQLPRPSPCRSGGDRLAHLCVEQAVAVGVGVCARGAPTPCTRGGGRQKRCPRVPVRLTINTAQ